MYSLKYMYIHMKNHRAMDFVQGTGAVHIYSKMISPYENMDITPTIPFPYNPEHP